MKKFKVFVKLDENIQTEMIISGKDKESVKLKMTHFICKLDENIKVEIEVIEVYFDGNNYKIKVG